MSLAMRIACATTLRLGAAMLACGVATPALAQSDMVKIPAGIFTMGNEDQRTTPLDETPPFQIFVAAFEMDRFLVTNADFVKFLNVKGPVNARGDATFDVGDDDARIRERDGKWTADPGFEDHPVVEVTWPGARDYCAWLGKRLPTEPEWEYAARGADKRRYPWGEAPPTAERARFGSPRNATAPVTAFPDNVSPFGVRGMAGYVWQWVSSAYRVYYPYRSDDGREDLNDLRADRTVRGGGHDNPPDMLTTSHRGRNVSRRPWLGHHNIGFRCAK